MNVLTLNGTTAVSLNRSPFSPTGNRNVAIANLSGSLPGGAVSIRLAAAGSGFVLASV